MRDGSSEHPKQMFKLIFKENIQTYCYLFVYLDICLRTIGIG